MAIKASDRKRMMAGLLAVLGLFFFSCTNALSAGMTGYSKNDSYQYVEMGTFPQTLEGGQEPILWRVLSVEGDTAYLLSEYVLMNARLHNDDTAYERSGGDFTKTEIYTYLNGEFLSNFSAQVLQMISTTQPDEYFTLLSLEDLKNKTYGFTGDTARRGYPTPWALQNGLFQYSNDSSPYWTRTQSTSHAYGAICTKEKGSLGYIRVQVQNEGMRPACYLDLRLLEICGGSGTMNDPYQIKSLGGTETR